MRNCPGSFGDGGAAAGGVSESGWGCGAGTPNGGASRPAGIGGTTGGALGSAGGIVAALPKSGIAGAGGKPCVSVKLGGIGGSSAPVSVAGADDTLKSGIGGSGGGAGIPKDISPVGTVGAGDVPGAVTSIIGGGGGTGMPVGS